MKIFTILFLSRQDSLLFNNPRREEIQANFAFILPLKDVKILTVEYLLIH